MGEVYALIAIYINDTYLASGSSDTSILIWTVNAPNFELYLRIEGSFSHSKAVRSLAFLSSGAFLASGSDDGSMIFWNLTKSNQIEQTAEHMIFKRIDASNGNGHISSVLTLISLGEWLVSGSADKSMNIWIGPKIGASGFVEPGRMGGVGETGASGRNQEFFGNGGFGGNLVGGFGLFVEIYHKF